MKLLLKYLRMEVDAVKDHYETALIFKDGSDHQNKHLKRASTAVDKCKTLINQIEKHSETNQ